MAVVCPSAARILLSLANAEFERGGDLGDGFDTWAIYREPARTSESRPAASRFRVITGGRPSVYRITGHYHHLRPPPLMRSSEPCQIQADAQGTLTALPCAGDKLPEPCAHRTTPDSLLTRKKLGQHGSENDPFRTVTRGSRAGALTPKVPLADRYLGSRVGRDCRRLVLA